MLQKAGPAIRVDPDAPSPRAGRHRGPFRIAKDAAIDAFERAYLTALLEAAGNNMSKAARMAGMDRMYLHRLVQKHGLRGGGAAGAGERRHSRPSATAQPQSHAPFSRERARHEPGRRAPTSRVRTSNARYAPPRRARASGVTRRPTRGMTQPTATHARARAPTRATVPAERTRRSAPARSRRPERGSGEGHARAPPIARAARVRSRRPARAARTPPATATTAPSVSKRRRSLATDARQDRGRDAEHRERPLGERHRAQHVRAARGVGGAVRERQHRLGHRHDDADEQAAEDRREPRAPRATYSRTAAGSFSARARASIGKRTRVTLKSSW